MKTLHELAKEIQENPDKVQSLLTSFRTTSTEIRDFLFSLQSVPTYMVPALLITFASNHREGDPKTIRDLMCGENWVNTMFMLVEDETHWKYKGPHISGKASCSPFNSELVMELDPDKAIKYVF